MTHSMPILRIATATEEALNACLNSRIWAVRYNLRGGWHPGQLVLVRVEHRLAALGAVTRATTQDQSLVFDPRYPMVVPMSWAWTAPALADRPPFDTWIKEELRAAFGSHYGFQILNQTKVPEPQATRILDALGERLHLHLNSLPGVTRRTSG